MTYCRCPECGEIVPCERVHNGIASVFHAVHCGYGHEVEPLALVNVYELDSARKLAEEERDESQELTAKKYWQGYVDGIAKALGETKTS